MNPKTQEYIEAEQIAVNKIKEQIIAKLPPGEKEKIEAVEKAVRIMTDAGVKFFLYPYLYNPDVRKNIVWQYNSITELTTFNDKGLPDGQSTQDIMNINHGIIYTIYENSSSFFLGKNATGEERCGYFYNYIGQCLHGYYNFLKDAENNIDTNQE